MTQRKPSLFIILIPQFIILTDELVGSGGVLHGELVVGDEGDVVLQMGDRARLQKDADFGIPWNQRLFDESMIVLMLSSFFIQTSR